MQPSDPPAAELALAPNTPGRSAAVVVAHPDDEVLWCGGVVLDRPAWAWHIVTACRASDADRAPKFQRVLKTLGATGAMADLNDGPEQTPLDPAHLQATVVALLGRREWDVVFTHGPHGEYTRHRRHEEVCRAVVALWAAGQLSTRVLALFAYEDGRRQYLPRPAPDADVALALTPPMWQRKYDLITEVYGFAADSWEARATPKHEAFRCFASADECREWIDRKGIPG